MILTLLNPETADLEKSYLANPYAIGTTSIVVKNADRFAVNDRIMLGEMGSEKTEIVTVSVAATDGMTITVGATVFSHEADTPVYKLRFDQVKFYRSTTGSTGSYSLLSTQNLDVDNANLTTIYDDTTGLSTYYYKMTLYNSVSTLESAFTDPIAGSGYSRNQVGYLIDQILQEVNDQNEQHVTRSEVLGYLNEVNDDLTISVAKPYAFLYTRSALSPVASQSYLDFPTDSSGNQTMWKFDHMDYNFLDSTTDPVTNITRTLQVEDPVYFRNRYTDNTIDSTTVSDDARVMTLDQSVNRFRFDHPFETTDGTLYLHYYQFFPTLDTEGDEILTPTPRIYKLFVKMRYYTKRQVVEPSFSATVQQFAGEYAVEKARLGQHNRKDVGTPRAFRIPTSVDNDFRPR